MSAMNSDLLKVLRKTRLAVLPEAKLQALVVGHRSFRVRAGESTYEEGETPKIGVVVRGLLRAYIKASDGRQVTVCYTRELEIMGAAVLIGGPAPACVQAMTDGHLVLLDAARVTELMRRDAEIACLLAEEVARRFYDVLDELAVNTFASVRQRVARQLLQLAAPGVGLRFPLVVPVNQQGLANSTGSVREVVARVLREFRQAGLVRRRSTGIEILDPIRLAEQVWSR